MCAQQSVLGTPSSIYVHGYVCAAEAAPLKGLWPKDKFILQQLHFEVPVTVWRCAEYRQVAVPVDKPMTQEVHLCKICGHGQCHGAADAHQKKFWLMDEVKVKQLHHKTIVALDKAMLQQVYP